MGTNKSRVTHTWGDYYSPDSHDLSALVTGRGATIVVAASDSLNKENADFVCSGTADEEWIQKAVNLGPTLLLKGTYSFSGPLTAVNNMHLSGEGAETILRLGNNVLDNVIVGSGLSGVTICNLKIDGNRANNAAQGDYAKQNGIRLQNCQDSAITDCFIVDTTYSGVQPGAKDLTEAGSSRISVLNCVFDGGGDGISAARMYNNVIKVNRIYNQVNYGVTIDQESVENIVTGNQIILPAGSIGIYLYAADRNSIVGNLVETNGNGIYLDSGSEKNTVACNVLEDNAGDGIRAVASSHYTIIEGNIIDASGNYGVYLDASSLCIISTNEITGAGWNGIYVKTCNFNVVRGNIISAAGAHGLSLEKSSWNIVSGNFFSNNGQATTDTYDDIILTDDAVTYSVYNQIIDNKMYASLTNKTRYGINENAAGDDYNEIHHNILTGQVTATIRTQGSNTKVSQNSGYVTGSIVAASDSVNRGSADYQCSGADDDVDIQKAIDALPAAGGRVILLEGNFLGGRWEIGSGVIVQGQGHANTTYKLADGENTEIVRSKDFATLTGQNKWLVGADGVPHGFGLMGITLDGNKANQSSGNGINFYGKRYIVDNVYIRDCKQVGFYSECGISPGQTDWRDTPEAMIGPLWVRNCDSHGIQYRGPNDCVFGRVFSLLNGGYGFIVQKAATYNGGCDITYLHTYSNTTGGVRVEAALQVGFLEAESGPGIKLDFATADASRCVVGQVKIYGAGHTTGINIDATATNVQIASGMISGGVNGILIKGVGTKIGPLEVRTQSALGVDIDAHDCQFHGVLINQSGTAIRLGQSGAVRRCIIEAYVQALSGGTAFDYVTAGTSNMVRLTGYVGTGATGYAGQAPAASDRFEIAFTGVGTNAKLSRNSGTSAVASGDTSKVVTHGLHSTPTVINIAFREQADEDYGRWWVSAIGATTFTLNVTADPGASNLDFAWAAKVR